MNSVRNSGFHPAQRLREKVIDKRQQRECGQAREIERESTESRNSDAVNTPAVSGNVEQLVSFAQTPDQRRQNQ